MKQLISGSFFGLISAVFLISANTSERADRKPLTVVIDDVPTTEQLIKQTDFYKDVERLEKEMDSLGIGKR